MKEEEKRILLCVAKNTIAKSLGLPYKDVEASSYSERKGAFVTLKINGHLRGCIGYLRSIKPLYQQIADLSLEASYRDPRFEKLCKEEFPLIEIEISVISEPKIINDLSEFKLSKNGIILIIGKYHAVFLPQVADEMGWNRDEMLAALSLKAGLPSDAYKREDAKFMIFSAEVFS